MTSNDNVQYVTVEVFNAGISELRSEIHRTNEEIKAAIAEMKHELRYQARDIEHLQTSIYWGFAVIAIVVALVGFVMTLAPMFREMYRDSKQAKKDTPPSRSEIQKMVDEAIAKALSAKK